MTVLPYAHTIVVVAAHPSVPDDGITFDDLVRIYRGDKSRWKNGQEIIVLTREPGNSSLLVLEEEIQGFKEAYAESIRAKRWTILYTYEQMIRVLRRTPNAMGIADMGAITAPRLAIKPLKVNGVSPAPENVQSGKYPLVKTMRLIFVKDKLSSEAKVFIDYVRSSQGRKVLKAAGLLPAE